MNLQLSIGITNNPRTWPIIDGTVKPDGIELIPTVLHPSELFWRHCILPNSRSQKCRAPRS